MTATTIFLILLSSIGFLCSGLFSAYLLLVKKNKGYLHLLLGGLLLVLSIRIGKSVFYNFTDLPVFVKNLGLAANLAVGPFLLFYAKVLIQQYEIQRRDVMHFLPAVLYTLLSPLIPNEAGNPLWYASYSIVIAQQLIYLIIAARLIKNWKAAWHHDQQKSFVILWGAISFIWLIYLLIFLQILPVYLFGSIAYSVLVILLAYLVMKDDLLLQQRAKYGQNRLSIQQSQAYLELLQNRIVHDQSYLNPNLSIQDISDQVELSTKLISQVINEQLKLNFSAFINRYRIEEAKKRLVMESYQQYTISSIAYDCGFNSISSFNTSFKAITKQTPSQFRKAFFKKTG